MATPHRPPRGEACGMAKLTEADVQAIRAARRAGEKLIVLAVQFGVSESTISLVSRGLTWGHLQQEAS